MHMRAFESPFFLCARGVAEADLPGLEAFATRYFDEWRELLETAQQLPPEEAASRRARRDHMSRTVIEQDPDRHLVVSVYGESTTQAIEEASMF